MRPDGWSDGWLDPLPARRARQPHIPARKARPKATPRLPTAGPARARPTAQQPGH